MNQAFDSVLRNLSWNNNPQLGIASVLRIGFITTLLWSPVFAPRNSRFHPIRLDPAGVIPARGYAQQPTGRRQPNSAAGTFDGPKASHRQRFTGSRGQLVGNRGVSQ